MSSNTVDDLPIGDVQFYDNYLPALKDDDYQITVSQSVGVENASIPTQTQKFSVRGPQFYLDPVEVHALFPAANASGRFGECLPHVVLNKRALPWERALDNQEDGTPWMALLLLVEDELVGGDQNSDTRTITSSVASLLADDPQVLKPAIKRVAASDLQTNCRSIVIAGDSFRALVPYGAELSYLAHCRQVNTGDKEVLGMKDDGWFSVVLGNRFPDAGPGTQGEGTKNIVHLVSLEGFESYLSENAQLPKMTSAGDEARDKNVRLVSLLSWTFTCLPDAGETFANLVEKFVADQDGNPELLRLTLPTPDATKLDAAALAAVRSKLDAGYVPLGYHTQTGEDTFAWYRGPLSPVPTPPLQRTAPLASASAAMIYDQHAGSFDLSMAAAWQIGRALALADRRFSTELFRFRQQGHRLVDMLLERLHSDYLDTPDDLAQLLGSKLIETQFITLMQQGITRHVQQAGADAAPALSSRGRSDVQLATSAAVATSPVDELKDFLARADVQALLQREARDDLEYIARWLARLRLLYNVPFNHLVADERMLPAESLRFFYLDRNWVNTLTDGALGAGTQGSRDYFYQSIMQDVIADAVATLTQSIRAQLRGVDVEPLPPPDGKESGAAMSGILIRSAVISGWPGLSVRAYLKGQMLKTLRMERLSENVLLCIFLDVPDRLEISEPQEGLHFGVDGSGGIELRSLVSPVGRPLGKTLQIYDPQHNSLLQFMRAGGRRVLKLKTESNADLLTALSQQLNVPALGPAGFAIQMVSAPEQVVFNGAD